MGLEDPLEKGVAAHSSILAWEIPWIEGPGRLQSMGHKESDITEKELSRRVTENHRETVLCPPTN